MSARAFFMATRTPIQRRAAGALLVASLSAAVVISARRLERPYRAEGPSFRTKGPADAKILIGEFSDFQCPACAAAHQPLKGIESLFEGRVRVVFKHFPLERRHPLAREAARAAECAGQQGKFWELHDRLFEKQPEWGEGASSDPDWTVKLAGGLGLDMPAFNACRKNPETDRGIDADIKEGNDQWVGSTPTFFINGKRFSGAGQLTKGGMRWIERQLKP